MIIPFSWVFVDDNLKYNVHEAETRKVHLDEQKKIMKKKPSCFLGFGQSNQLKVWS